MGLFDRFKKNETNDNRNLSVPQNAGIIENSEGMLAEVSMDLSEKAHTKLPIAQLAALGGGVSSLLPALRTVTTTITTSNHGLYQCIFPKGVSGYLASAHGDGLNIGTIMNKKGIVAQARWVKAGPQTFNVSSVAPINPATLMMAAALMAIDKKLDEVLEIEKKILSFLEQDKEASIEGDLRTLVSIFKEYKFNWDDATYISTHHQLAADIKRTAEGNLGFYQKQVADLLDGGKLLHLQQDVSSKQSELEKKLKYYRLCLYIYAFASFIEVMLQGKYDSGYIGQIHQEITERINQYTNVYDACYKVLDNLSTTSIDRQVLKGIGLAGKAIGNLIGNTPFLKDGDVDEWLVEKGAFLEQSAENAGKNLLSRFEPMRDSGCTMFMEKLEQVDKLFNGTNEIYIDSENVYLA